MKLNTSKTSFRLTTMGMLAALSVVLVMLVRFPLFPAAPFLMYDMADIPVLIGGMLLGPVEGLGILLVVSVIQAFLLSPDGWVGLVMHFCASGALVLLSSLIYRAKPRAFNMVAGLLAGSVAMTAIMVPLNLLLTVHVYGQPMEVVAAMIWPVIVPFNLIKSLINSAATFVISMPIGYYFRRTAHSM